MSKWFSSVSRMLALATCLASSNQAVRAGEFPVVTRNDVLVLTSKIQATQFLTHATFGASQAEIDALALQMQASGTIAAASAWIDAQTAGAYNPSVSGHSALERQWVDFDIANFSSLYSRTGTAPASYTYVPNGATPTASNVWSRT